MKILNMVSKSFTCPPITLKFFGQKFCMLVEISTDFDLLSTIEFQIYRFILSILQTNLGEILAKMLSNCVICITSFHPKHKQEIAETHGAFIVIGVRATHTFDANGCDTLLHSSQKRKCRSYPAPLWTDHILRDWKRACEEVCHARTIQRYFMQVLRRNTEGDIDESLVKFIRDWY